MEVKTLEEKAVTAMTEVLHQASLLGNSWDDFPEAARLLEKIQMAESEAERASLAAHTDRAAVSCRVAHHVSILARELFHEIKQRSTSRSSA